MSEATDLLKGNFLLDSIPRPDLALLATHLEWTDLVTHDVLHSANKPTNYLYFPISGICSILAIGNDGKRIETGIIGKEGLVGVSLCLSVEDAPFHVVVQIPGRSMRIAEHHFMPIFNSSVDMRKVILRFAYSFLVQTSQTVLANGRMTIQQRLARWLLMCQDRVEMPEFVMTHQFLSDMLAVRRSGITVALQVLEDRKAIQSKRGKVRILNRTLLKQMAGSAYGVAEKEYQRVLGSKK